MNRDLTTIAAHYITAILFTDSGSADDDLTGKENFSEQAIEAIKADCAEFVKLAGDLLTPEWTDEQIGYDIWLTRNGHGAGFWDRDLPNGDALTAITDTMGPLTAYVGDDGLIYLHK